MPTLPICWFPIFRYPSFSIFPKSSISSIGRQPFEWDALAEPPDFRISWYPSFVIFPKSPISGIRHRPFERDALAEPPNFLISWYPIISSPFVCEAWRQHARLLSEPSVGGFLGFLYLYRGKRKASHPNAFGPSYERRDLILAVKFGQVTKRILWLLNPLRKSWAGSPWVGFAKIFLDPYFQFQPLDFKIGPEELSMVNCIEASRSRHSY